MTEGFDLLESSINDMKQLRGLLRSFSQSLAAASCFPLLGIFVCKHSVCMVSESQAVQVVLTCPIQVALLLAAHHQMDEPVHSHVCVCVGVCMA